jgi:hypothetical protein
MNEFEDEDEMFLSVLAERYKQKQNKTNQIQNKTNQNESSQKKSKKAKLYSNNF